MFKQIIKQTKLTPLRGGHPILTTLCALCTFVGSVLHGAPIPYPQALEEAKKDNKVVIVLCDGSDWLVSSPDARKAYDELSKSLPTLDSKVIWAIHDELDKQTEEQKKAPKPPVKVWNYPALQVLDNEGRPLFAASGLSADEIKSSKDAIPKALEARDKRDELWKTAEAAKGKDKVNILGQGLDTLPEKIAREYKPILETMKTEDPADSTGYYTKYTFGASGYMENNVVKYCAEHLKPEERDIAKAYKNVADTLKLPKLTLYQKQVVTAAKFRIALAESNLATDPAVKKAKLHDAMNYLKQVTSLAPNTEMGRGAQTVLNYYTQPVIKLKGLSWDQRDNRPDWTTLQAEVPASTFKEVGSYDIEFRHKQGNTRFRNPAIKSGSKAISYINDDKEGRKFSLIITQPVTATRLTIDVQACGTGWFDGCGDIIVTKKN